MATKKLIKTRLTMESEQETFACPVDPFCLGMCSWTGCPGNADLATTESHELEFHPPNISHLIGSLLAHAQALSQGHYGNKETNQN